MPEWLEPATAARGSVVVIGGRGETPGLYERLSRRLAVDGYRVTTITPLPDGADGAELTLGELESEALSVLLTLPTDVPAVLIGSDTGATVAARAAAATTADSLSGIVLAGLPTAGAAQAAPPSDWESELQARSACPVHRGALGRPGAVATGRFDAPPPEAPIDEIARIGVPVLAIHGDGDVVSPIDEAIEVYAGAPGSEIVRVADGLHDILNDVSHRSVAAEIVQFLERLRLPGTPRIILRVRTGSLEAVAGRL